MAKSYSNNNDLIKNLINKEPNEDMAILKKSISSSNSSNNNQNEIKEYIIETLPENYT